MSFFNFLTAVIDNKQTGPNTPSFTVSQVAEISLFEGILIAIAVLWGIPILIALIITKIKNRKNNKKPHKDDE